MQKVKVVSVEIGSYYTSEYASGSTVNVTLQRGKDFASCEGILIWDEDCADSDLFDEWVAQAMEGTEGYTAMVDEGDITMFY